MPSCPVTFDFATAESAAAEARRHATFLDGLAEARASARAVVVEEWRGRFRDDFDREFTATQAQLGDEADALRHLAGAVDDATADALTAKVTCERTHDHAGGQDDPLTGPR